MAQQVRNVCDRRANNTRTSKSRKQPKPSYAILNRLAANLFPVSYIR